MGSFGIRRRVARPHAYVLAARASEQDIAGLVLDVHGQTICEYTATLAYVASSDAEYEANAQLLMADIVEPAIQSAYPTASESELRALYDSVAAVTLPASALGNIIATTGAQRGPIYPTTNTPALDDVAVLGDIQ